MQWFRRTQVTGLPGQVVDLIRYRDGQRLARYTVPAEGVVQVDYLESLGECALLLHERGEETVGLWQANTAVARNALLYSPLFPGRVLRCARPGVTGASAPTPAAVKLGWLHSGDVTNPLADLSLTSDGGLWGYAISTLWGSEQDGSPAGWPVTDVVHLVASANHLVGLRYDGSLLVKNINTAYATAYASLKSLTDVVHVTASQFALHAHRASGEVVSVIDSSSYDTTPNRNLLAGTQPCPGFGVVHTTAMRIVGGVIQSANASQQSAVSAFTDVVYAITNSALLVALVRANGEVRLIDPAVPANNVTIAAGSVTDPVVQIGATARSVYAVGARGRRWVLANSEVGGTSAAYVHAEMLAGFQGVPPEQLQLVTQPFVAGTGSRLLVSTPDSVAYLYKGDYPSSTLGRRRTWKTPRFRILVNGTASFYVEPYAAALLQPVWERIEQEVSASQGRVQCTVAVDGEGAARQLLAMSWPVGDTPRVLWQGRSAADGTAEAVWNDPVPGEQALVVALDDWGNPWMANHAYVQGDVIRPSGAFAGVVYVCLTAGTSSASQPAWWADGQGAVGTAVFEARPYRRPLAHGPITPTVTSS
ncbi:hypothetical protein [Metapseudomonas resinovorans]|uniref:hypothetical protein n=1 Tax=Metapseudomonas resinovorans TaxID=53412 RepID=UPI003D201507